MTNTTLKNKLTDSQSGYRAYNKKVISEITPSELGMGVSTEILIKASNKEFVIGEVPITVSYEGNTSTHNPVSRTTLTKEYKSIAATLKITPKIVIVAPISVIFVTSLPPSEKIWIDQTTNIIPTIKKIAAGIP